MSPMTPEEAARLRTVENEHAGMKVLCGGLESEIEKDRKRIVAMEKWKDKFLLLIIGLLITNTASLAVALVTLIKK